MNAVVVENVVKRYGSVAAVDGVSLTIAEGKVFALLGPNGAGKTSLVEILEGHRRRDGGNVRVLGFDPASGGRMMRERIGIVLQEGGLKGELTVVETVRYHASLFPRPKDVDEVIRIVGLEEKRRSQVRLLSGGQRRRLELALGLVGDPESDLPRRADDRIRSRGAAPGVGASAQPARLRQDHRAHHPLHGRSAGTGRPHCRDRPR